MTLIIGSISTTFADKMKLMKEEIYKSFNFNEDINPIVKALISQSNGDTPEGKINLITGENYVKIHEQHEVLETFAKDLTRSALQQFKDDTIDRYKKVDVLYADFAELLDNSLDFANTITINKEKYTMFLEMPEEKFSAITSEMFHLWREHEQYIDYLDLQFDKYITGIHEIVQNKCPGYKVKKIDNFPNTSKFN